MEYSYKLIFDKQGFTLDGKLRKNLESEYGLIRQIDDILDGDTGIIYSFDKKVELIRWYESQGGIKETVNHWFAELNQNLSSENIFVMHQTKHSHLLKLLKDIIKNQIFLGKLIIDKSEILLRTNIFNSIKFLRDTNCEIKSLPADLELGDNNFIGDLIKLGFNFEKINVIFNKLISSIKVDLALVKELSGYDKILRQSQYQIDQYNFFYKTELEKYITEKNNEEFIESMKQSKFLLVLAMKHLYPENEIKEFWRF